MTKPEKAIDPAEAALEAGISQEKAISMLQFLIDDGWLTEHFVDFSLGGGMGKKVHVGTDEENEPGVEKPDHFFYDSSGHLWVDLTRVTLNGELILSRSTSEKTVDYENSTQEIHKMASAAVAKDKPDMLSIWIETRVGEYSGLPYPE